MSEKMTVERFFEKVAWEGVEYAFTGYGLSADDLDDDTPQGIIEAVEEVAEAYEAIEFAVNRMYEMVRTLGYEVVE